MLASSCRRTSFSTTSFPRVWGGRCSETDMMPRRFILATLAAMPLVGYGSLPADAHAFLDHAVPAVGSTLKTPPSEVRLWFTEDLEVAFSSVKVVDPSGTRVDRDDKQVDPSDKTLLKISVPTLQIRSSTRPCLVHTP